MNKNLLSYYLNSIEPYTPGEQPRNSDIIKLNTNENPYPPSPKVLEAISEIKSENLRLYPDPECLELREVIAYCYRLRYDEVFIGNGSDEIISMAFMAFFKKRKPILFSDITYSFYKVCASLLEIPYEIVILDSDFNFIIDQYNKDNDGIIMANPNAPTGMEISLDIIEEIVKSNPGRVVIIDEAYMGFGAVSAVPLIKKYPNLLIIQTLSKSHSLAGIRVGFALGDNSLIDGLWKVKNCFNSYTVDRIAQACAKASLLDFDYLKNTSGKIIGTRDWSIKALKEAGFNVLDSKANFIFTANNAVRLR